MAFASGSRHGMSYVEESSFGETPSSPTLTPIRHNSTTLGLEKETIESEEIRSDRQIADVRHGVRTGSGDIVGELSFETFDDFLAGALCGEWDETSGTDPSLKAGTTRKSFTIQREFADIGQYQVFTGCQVNSMSLSVEPNSMVSLTFSMWAQDMSPDSSAITDSTTEDATTSSPVDTFSGTIDEGGSEIAIVTSLELSLENSLEGRNRIGSKTSAEPSIGRSNMSGTLTAYFEDADLLDKFLNETESSITVELLDGEGNGYEIFLPRVKYTTGRSDVEGEGDITVPLEFRALYDDTEETNIVITKVTA